MLHNIIEQWIGEVECREHENKSQELKDVEYLPCLECSHLQITLKSCIPELEEKIVEIIKNVTVKENPPFSEDIGNAEIINMYLMPIVTETIINKLKGGKE